MGTEIRAAFTQLGASPLGASALSPYVQGADAALISAISAGTTHFGTGNPVFLPDRLIVTSLDRQGAVATVGFSAANGYGPYRFVGTAVYDGARWKVSWVTVCMLLEEESVLCPNAPPGVDAPLPLPYSLTDAQHLAAETPGLLRPESLALERDGDLLIADVFRDEVLRLTPGGVLTVFAGDGVEGALGDGGPAVDAELDLQDEPQIAVAPDGTVYIPDAGNCRLQAVAPNGVIRTASDAGVLCNVGGVAVSPTGVPYVTAQGTVDAVSPRGKLATVAGSSGEIVNNGPDPTPLTLAFAPYSLAFDGRGDLDIWSFEPRTVYRLTPQGTISALGGFVYATQISPSPGGSVFLAGYHGGVYRVTSTGIAPYNSLSPSEISRLRWPTKGVGFQADGIAVSSSGVIYAVNDGGNGYGDGTVLVEVEPSGSAHVVPVRTPVLDTLPALDASGFPITVYPAPRPPRVPGGPQMCPSTQGLVSFNQTAAAEASAIAVEVNSSSLPNDLHNSDRAWWASDFELLEGGGVDGQHTVLSSRAASGDSFAAAVAAACGSQLVRDSLVVDIGQSPYSGEVSHLYFLDRDGHPLVYFQAS
jgi:hypothetical protein